MRHTRYSKNIFLIQLLLDIGFIFILLSYFLNAQYLETGKHLTAEQVIKAHYKVLILFVFSWHFISVNIRLYNINRFNGLIYILKKNIYQIALFSIIVFAVSGFKTNDLFPTRVSLYFLFILFILTFSSRFVIFILLKLYRRSGGNFRRIIFIDENTNTSSVINLLEKRKDFGLINFGNFFSEAENDEAKGIGNFDLKKLRHFIVKENIQIIFFSLNGKLNQDIQENIILLAQRLHIGIRFIPGNIYDSFSSLKIEYYDTFPILTYNVFPLDNLWNRLLKRAFDIIFSLMVILLICIWLFPIIAIAILLDSGRPIFYLQKRIGLKGKSFYCYKFRTMKASKDNDIKATVKGDTRITRLGNLLRKSSIDELPQFFNVIRGNMSVVGPRPHMVTQDEYYNDLFLKYSLRHYVKPGITGLAQVKGFRGEINSKEDMRKRVISDVYYVKNWSFLLDVGIIIGTLFKVASGDEKAV